MNKGADQSFLYEEKNLFGERLRLAIGSESVREFAKKCGISDTMIHKYLKGKASPSFSKLELIAKAADKPVAWFTGDNETVGLHGENECSDVVCRLSDIIQNYMTPEERLKAVEVFRKGGLMALMPAVVEDEPQKSVESVLGRDLSGRANAAETEEEQAQVTRKGKVAG
ncbi:helix-turn-helix domain-containing protein [Salmonella enterica]|uniref:Helix-turn-helix transcriptional regulator n=1 Tax=Salmonella enterica subsp. enterica serovar Lattenkamp TaxID=2564671 RepID=A0A734CJ25_SALET|nr:helix-turn-helix transcriptional regulator [Salmonella enterica]EBV5318841.1 XRE family transcriptional regulator [Salmonella enterica subsp. enterica serovar Bredeney]EBY0815837.1 XRE family transcriptional regulator [Salmonella enterica subsp. enterica serovar Lattenkamp]ECC8924939.1 XRE family transcriptional regulator [Salmonella bongori]ECE6505305.1 XRE family transcriptional regulator [Salmonella enterica subsp. salamae]ECG8259001.1 XRE family transcriptional regulator [Salmonella bon